MNKLISLFFAAAAAVLLAACSSSNNDTVTEQSFPACFAYVNDMTNDVSAAYTNVGYTVRLNYTKLTAEVTITNLRITDGTVYPTITVSDIPWTLNPDGYFVIAGSNLPSSTPAGVAAPIFSTFRLSIMERLVEGFYRPGFSFSYSLNQRFSVLSSNADQIIFGTTTSVNDKNEEYKTDQTSYRLEFNIDTKRLKLTMLKSNFMQGMPALNIVLENIPYEFDGGTARWNVAAITPKIGDTPYESFPITDLKGEFNFATGMTLSFICDPAKAPGKYTVTAVCSFKDQAPEV